MYIIWIGLLPKELPKVEAVGSYFNFQIFTVRQYVRYQINDTICFPFHMEQSPAKIQPAIASDSTSHFLWQPALNDHPERATSLIPWLFCITLSRQNHLLTVLHCYSHKQWHHCYLLTIFKSYTIPWALTVSLWHRHLLLATKMATNMLCEEENGWFYY